MLEKSLRLTFQTMLAIYKSGFTRVPVFEGSRQNIVAVMYAKDLILVDPDDSIQVGTVLSFRWLLQLSQQTNLGLTRKAGRKLSICLHTPARVELMSFLKMSSILC